MQVYHYNMNFSKQLLVNFVSSTTTKEHASRFLKCTCIFISGLKVVANKDFGHSRK